MQVSREFTLAQLKLVRDTLSSWIKDIDIPMEAHADGTEVPIYSEEMMPMPLSISIADLEGIPETQLRAELMSLAATLEGLAAT